jgi:hypothetical protein
MCQELEGHSDAIVELHLADLLARAQARRDSSGADMKRVNACLKLLSGARAPTALLKVLVHVTSMSRSINSK